MTRVKGWLWLWLQWFLASFLSNLIALFGTIVWFGLGAGIMTRLAPAIQPIFEGQVDISFIMLFILNVASSMGTALVIGFSQYIVLRRKITNAISWVLAGAAIAATSTAIGQVFSFRELIVWQGIQTIILFGWLQAVSISRRPRWIVYWTSALLVSQLILSPIVRFLHVYSKQVVEHFGLILTGSVDETIYFILANLVSSVIEAVLPILLGSLITGIAVAQFLTEIEQTSPYLSKRPVQIQ